MTARQALMTLWDRIATAWHARRTLRINAARLREDFNDGSVAAAVAQQEFEATCSVYRGPDARLLTKEETL